MRGNGRESSPPPLVTLFLHTQTPMEREDPELRDEVRVNEEPMELPRLCDPLKLVFEERQ
jgi:hypothetical protein